MSIMSRGQFYPDHIWSVDAPRSITDAHLREILLRHEIPRRRLTVSAAPAASAACVLAAFSASVAGAAAPIAAFSLGQCSVSPAADVPCPASAGGSADPGSASSLPFPVPSGISGPALRFPSSE